MSRKGATERVRRRQIAEIEWEFVWQREIERHILKINNKQ